MSLIVITFRSLYKSFKLTQHISIRLFTLVSIIQFILGRIQNQKCTRPNKMKLFLVIIVVGFVQVGFFFKTNCSFGVIFRVYFQLCICASIAINEETNGTNQTKIETTDMQNDTAQDDHDHDIELLERILLSSNESEQNINATELYFTQLKKRRENQTENSEIEAIVFRYLSLNHVSILK